ncbi:hypothetical protein [Glutamicibacter soli]|uniref:hypothetical protein n=1 Tax=Glutamicibacter soli TaxID=453836 RepID=UPI003FD0FA9A
MNDMTTNLNEILVSNLPEGQVSAMGVVPACAFKPSTIDEVSWGRWLTSMESKIEDVCLHELGVWIEILGGTVRFTALLLDDDGDEVSGLVTDALAAAANGKLTGLLQRALGLQGYAPGGDPRLMPTKFPVGVTNWEELPYNFPNASELTGHQREAVIKLLDAGLVLAEDWIHISGFDEVSLSLQSGSSGVLTAFVGLDGQIRSAVAESSDSAKARGLARLGQRHPLRTKLAALGFQLP